MASEAKYILTFELFDLNYLCYHAFLGSIFHYFKIV